MSFHQKLRKESNETMVTSVTHLMHCMHFQLKKCHRNLLYSVIWIPIGTSVIKFPSMEYVMTHILCVAVMNIHIFIHTTYTLYIIYCTASAATALQSKL